MSDLPLDGFSGFDSESSDLGDFGTTPAPAPVLPTPRLALPPGGAPRQPPPRAPAPQYAGPSYGYGYGDAGLPSTLPLPNLPAAASPPAPAPTVDDGHSLGLALLLVGAGGAIGLHYGGAFGAAAGGLYGGALMNMIRAARCVTEGQADADKEAAVSATYGVLGAGLASYIVWKTHSEKKSRHHGEESEEELSAE